MSPARSRTLSCTAAAAMLSIVTQWSGGAEAAADDPFTFLAPAVVVSGADRTRLDRNEILARTLPGRGGQLAVFVATRLDAPPDALVAWTRAIAELKRSKFVLAIGRFSDPPRPSDLDELTLDQRDLDAIRRCRPGDCGLKLSAVEIASLKAAAAASGDGWRDAVQQEFRRLLAKRVIDYRAHGLGALAPAGDARTSSTPDEVLSAIIEQSPYLERLQNVVAWLKKYPRTEANIESFVYWSKEHYGEGKPVISLTHVGIIRREAGPGQPAILVVGKQIFATHYLEGSVGLTMVVRDASTGVSYLAYLNRSQIDILRGFFGVFVRSALEGRIERQGPVIVRGLRARLESGRPPDEGR